MTIESLLIRIMIGLLLCAIISYLLFIVIAFGIAAIQVLVWVFEMVSRGGIFVG
jgi:hypothetical protein